MHNDLAYNWALKMLEIINKLGLETTHLDPS